MCGIMIKWFITCEGHNFCLPTTYNFIFNQRSDRKMLAIDQGGHPHKWSTLIKDQPYELVGPSVEISDEKNNPYGKFSLSDKEMEKERTWSLRRSASQSLSSNNTLVSS